MGYKRRNPRLARGSAFTAGDDSLLNIFRENQEAYNRSNQQFLIADSETEATANQSYKKLARKSVRKIELCAHLSEKFITRHLQPFFVIHSRKVSNANK